MFVSGFSGGGGERGPTLIALVLVIQWFRLLMGGISLSKKWAPYRVVPIGLLVAYCTCHGSWDCSIRCLLFSALGWGFALPSLFGWSCLCQYIKIPPSISSLCWEVGKDIWPAGLVRPGRLDMALALCMERLLDGFNIGPIGHLGMFSRGP